MQRPACSHGLRIPPHGLRQASVFLLSFGWGFVSDVDIINKRYYKLGNACFTVGIFQLLTSLQVYKGSLSYLPAEVQSSASNSYRGEYLPSPQHPNRSPLLMGSLLSTSSLSPEFVTIIFTG